MAALGALNALLYGRQIAKGFWSQVGLLIAVSIASFLLLGVLFFPLAYVDESKPTESFTPGRWTRPFSKIQVLTAYLVAGWLAALFIVGVGDYLVRHRFATRSELGTAMLVALIVGPVIALIAAGYVAHLRSLQREFGRDDSEPM
jgi:hypothetical protein